MNLEKTNQWLAITANLGVLVGIIFLAFEIRVNTLSVNAAIYESALDGYNNINEIWLSDADLSSIVRRGQLDLPSLNADERFRFELVSRTFANQVYKLFRLYEIGLYPEEEWENSAREAVQIFAFYPEFLEQNGYFEDLRLELAKYEPSKFNQYHSN